MALVLELAAKGDGGNVRLDWNQSREAGFGRVRLPAESIKIARYLSVELAVGRLSVGCGLTAWRRRLDGHGRLQIISCAILPFAGRIEADFTVMFPSFRPSVWFVLGRYPGGVPNAETMEAKHAATVKSENSIFAIRNQESRINLEQDRKEKGKFRYTYDLDSGSIQTLGLRLENRKRHRISKRHSKTA